MNDEDNYSKMKVPFATVELANDAIQKFFAELHELRCKHNLADVTAIVKDSIAGSGTFMTDCHCGSYMEVEVMAAWHLGQASAQRQNIVRQALEEGSVESIKTVKVKR